MGGRVEIVEGEVRAMVGAEHGALKLFKAVVSFKGSGGVMSVLCRGCYTQE